MSEQENGKIIRDYFAACNRDWEDAIERYVSDPALEGHIRFFQKALPGYQIEAHEMIAHGDEVAVRATARGVHRGELGGVEPTGREVAVPFMIIYRVVDGRIVEHSMVADQDGLMRQITAQSLQVGRP